MMKSLWVGMVALISATSIEAATAFPFPRNAAYPYGIKAATASSNGAEVQAAYENWLSNQYVESGNLARVKFDDQSYTVSEGIGYGMLIFVYMDNSTNNTKSKFDKLWAYYKANANSNGLMNWKISGFSNSCSGDNCNGATDADLDVAMALMMAYKQWGDASYLTDAKALIASIHKNEISTSVRGLLKPGDAWEAKYNPSYVSTAALELFKQVDNSDWSGALTANYTMLKGNANSTSGLFSDWCSSSGSPLNDKFGYDAVRTPWRMAVAHAWFGHADAKTLDSKIAAWETSSSSSIKNDPANIGDGYTLDGRETSGYEVATYVGALVSAGMVDSKYQSWVNDGYTELSSFAVDESYYHRSLKVLYMLTLSGNFNNFWGSNTGGGTTTPSKFALVANATNGTVALDPAGDSYDSAKVVTATATPNAGYKFTSWSGDCSGTTPTCSIAMTKDRTITANFSKVVVPTYTLTVGATTNGTISLSPTGGSYDSNTTVAATATPAQGFVFSNWTGACTGTGACNVVMNANKALSAVFSPIPPATYVLTVNVGTGGKVVKSPDSASYSAGKVVTLTARPDSTYKFSGWQGDCSGSDTTCTVTMSAAKSVTASFTAVPYHSLTLSGNNGKLVASPVGPKYAEGSTVTVTAVPDEGYVFSAWYSGCNTSNGSTCTVVIPNYDVTVNAGFAQAPVGISRRLPNGERLLLSRGMIAFDARDIGPARLELTDLQGRTKLLWQGQGSQLQELPMQGVRPGLYFLHLSGAKSSFQKFVQILH